MTGWPVVAIDAFAWFVIGMLVATVLGAFRRHRALSAAPAARTAVPPPLMPDQQARAREQYRDLELAEARGRLAAATEDANRVMTEFTRLVARFIEQHKETA